MATAGRRLSAPGKLLAGHRPHVEFVTCVLWPPNAPPEDSRWVAVRAPPNGTDFAHTQYLPCGYGTQCKYGTSCTRAHSDPPEAEIAYWNWTQPLRGAARRRRGTSDRTARPEVKREGFLCQVCQVVMNSYSQLLQHLSGAKHKAQAEAAALTGDMPTGDELCLSDSCTSLSLMLTPPLNTRRGLTVASMSEGGSPALSRVYTRLPRSPNARQSPQNSASPRLSGHRRPLSAPGSPRLGVGALARPSRSDRATRGVQPTTQADARLLHAVVQGHVNAAQDAVTDGANINARRDGAPALHWAVHHQHVEMALFLITLGASRDDVDREHQTALHLALHASITNASVRLSILRALLTQGWNSNVQNRQGRAPLHFCVDRCDLDAAELLLKARANPHLPDALGYTPLLLASWRMQKSKGHESQKMHQLLSSWISVATQSGPTTAAPSLSASSGSTGASARSAAGAAVSPGQGVSIIHLEQVAPTFRPLFKALALFPYGASVELWRLSGLLKPIVTRLNMKRKAYVLQAQDAGYVTVHQSDNQKQLYVRVAPQWRHVLEADMASVEDEAGNDGFSASDVEQHHDMLGAIFEPQLSNESQDYDVSEGGELDCATESPAAAADIVGAVSALHMQHTSTPATSSPRSSAEGTALSEDAATPSLAEATMGSSVPAMLTPLDPAIARATATTSASASGSSASMAAEWSSGTSTSSAATITRSAMHNSGGSTHAHAHHSSAALPTRPPQGLGPRRRPASAGNAIRPAGFGQTVLLPPQNGMRPQGSSPRPTDSSGSSGGDRRYDHGFYTAAAFLPPGNSMVEGFAQLNLYEQGGHSMPPYQHALTGHYSHGTYDSEGDVYDSSHKDSRGYPPYDGSHRDAYPQQNELPYDLSGHGHHMPGGTEQSHSGENHYHSGVSSSGHGHRHRPPRLDLTATHQQQQPGELSGRRGMMPLRSAPLPMTGPMHPPHFFHGSDETALGGYTHDHQLMPPGGWNSLEHVHPLPPGYAFVPEHHVHDSGTHTVPLPSRPTGTDSLNNTAVSSGAVGTAHLFGTNVWASTEAEDLIDWHHTHNQAHGDPLPDDVSAGWLAGVEEVLADTPGTSARGSESVLAGFLASPL